MDSVRVSLALFALAVAAGCSAVGTSKLTESASSGAGAGTGTGMGGGSGTGAGSGTTAGTGMGGAMASSTAGSGASFVTGSGAGGGVTIDAGPLPDGGNSQVAEVFGHTPTELYKLNPVTKAVTDVGPFVNCDADTNAVIDLAIDKSGQMYVTTFGGFYKVDKTNASCTLIAPGYTFPNSLSFVPVGTLDPNVEALVGYQGALYERIDLTTGGISTVGSLSDQGYLSSGDIVSVIGGGTYLTVQGGTDCSSFDCIVEVDPKTGALKKMIGAVGHTDVYGLAFWAGSAYGFDDTGHLFQIDLTSGAPTEIAIPNAPPFLTWFGAGSTTAAPLSTQ